MSQPSPQRERGGVASWDAFDTDAFGKILHLGQSFTRLAGTNWLIKTTSPIDLWYRRFEPILPDGSEIFIIQVDLTNRQGLLPKASWDWINTQTPAKPAGLLK
jgi:hypothetical protein